MIVLRPGVLSRILFGLIFAVYIVLAAVLDPGSDSYAVIALVALLLVLHILAGMAIRVVATSEWVTVRGWLLSVTVPAERVLGVGFSTGMTLVLKGGVTLQTAVVQGWFARERRKRAVAGQISHVLRREVQILSRADYEVELRSSDGEGAASVRSIVRTVARPYWWQGALAILLLAVLAGRWVVWSLS